MFFVCRQPEADSAINKERSKKTQKKYDERKKTAQVEHNLEEQFATGRVLGKLHNVEQKCHQKCVPVHVENSNYLHLFSAIINFEYVHVSRHPEQSFDLHRFPIKCL